MIKWMANMKNNGNKKDGKNLNVLGRCDLPYVVKDKKIMDLNKKEMVCGKNECFSATKCSLKLFELKYKISEVETNGTT